MDVDRDLRVWCLDGIRYVELESCQAFARAAAPSCASPESLRAWLVMIKPGYLVPLLEIDLGTAVVGFLLSWQWGRTMR